MGDLAAAEKRLRAALAQAPQSAQLHDELGIVLARQRRYPEALRLFERALQLDPALPHTRRRVADVLTACGRGAEADRHYAAIPGAASRPQGDRGRSRAPARRPAN